MCCLLPPRIKKGWKVKAQWPSAAMLRVLYSTYLVYAVYVEQLGITDLEMLYGVLLDITTCSQRHLVQFFLLPTLFLTKWQKAWP